MQALQKLSITFGQTMGNKSVLITGACGQDGSYLAKVLLDNGFHVTGTCRKNSANYFWRLKQLGILNRVELVDLHIGQSSELNSLVADKKFDWIFHLAGDSFTADSFTHPYRTLNTNTHGTIEILESVRINSQSTKVFLAGSSEIFQNETRFPILCNEESPESPKSPYGVSQLANRYLARIYREAYGLFVAYGILFNHESPLRADYFVTQKIVKGLSDLRRGSLEPLILGNLEASKDFGDARDFVRAFIATIELDNPLDFVVATGKLTKVREILKISAQIFGYEPIFIGDGLEEICIDDKSGQKIAQVSSKFFRQLENNPITGDSTKLRRLTGWNPSYSIQDTLVDMCSENSARSLK